MKELERLRQKSLKIGFRGFVALVKESAFEPLLNATHRSHDRTAVFGFALGDAVNISTQWLKSANNQERAVAHFVPTFQNYDKALPALGDWLDNIF